MTIWLSPEAITVRIRAPLTPQRLIDSGKGFVDEEESLRAPRTKRKGSRVFTWYFLRRSARIRPSKLHARRNAERLQRTEMASIFEREMYAALRSARSRSASFSSEMGRALYLAARGKFPGTGKVSGVLR